MPDLIRFAVDSLCSLHFENDCCNVWQPALPVLTWRDGGETDACAVSPAACFGMEKLLCVLIKFDKRKL